MNTSLSFYKIPYKTYFNNTIYYLILLSFTFSNYIPSFYNYIYLCNFKIVSTPYYHYVLFCFEMGGISTWSWLFRNSLCRPGWLEIQRSTCLSLPRKACATTPGLSYLFYIFSPYILLNPKGNFIGSPG